MLLRTCCLASVIAIVAGCGSETPPPASDFAGDVIPPEVPTPGDAINAADAGEMAEITLESAEWEEIAADIASHEGRIVVVDLWATYCAPCREAFPGLVALSREQPDDVVCISVSLDESDKQGKALEFLVEQDARMQNYYCTTDSDKLYDEILQIGSIPAVYVYGRDGELAKLFNGRSPDGGDHNYEDHIRPFVEELLAAE